MWRGTEGSNARASARAGGIAVVVLALAIFGSAMAIMITSDEEGASSFARLGATLERLSGTTPAAAPPVAQVSEQPAAATSLVASQPLLRSRPSGEREAVTRVVPTAQQDVHQLGLALNTTESDPPPLTSGTRILAEVTFYYCEHSDRTPSGDGGAFCEWMRDGTVVYPGAAACHYNYLGQRFTIEGDPLERVYTCNDTGNMILGQHRDIWFMTSAEGWAWQKVVGQYAVIQIIEADAS
ncbi:MAG TPA: hypothetical protein QGI71_03590 [Dehalococcoidia bacterium]|jgi:hypothetical protein|nr:hypothetical protein [Dehalococcoidia bacterium]